MTDVSEVAENIYMIDNQLFGIPRWGSVYLLNEDKKALIETGPTTSAVTVLDGIKSIGVSPEDINYITVTHIHLDHAGGVGVLAREMPQAQIMVHHKGARHLINPTRLLQSTIDARGDDVIASHGEVLPVDTHRLRAINDGDTISLGNQQILKFVDAPGHAPHELCIFETRNGGLFTGDAVAVYIAECDILLPFHPPPHFNLELCLKTLERLEDFSAQIIYYSHFGTSDKVQEHVSIAREKLMTWDNIVMNAIKEGAFKDASNRLISQACTEVEPMKGVIYLEPLYEYLVNVHIPLCAVGHTKYYQETFTVNIS